jgi:hypothetical protein
MLLVTIGCKKDDPCVEFETACTTWCEGDERTACLEEATALKSAGVETACSDAHMGLVCRDYSEVECLDGWFVGPDGSCYPMQDTQDWDTDPDTDPDR